MQRRCRTATVLRTPSPGRRHSGARCAAGLGMRLKSGSVIATTLCALCIIPIRFGYPRVKRHLAKKRLLTRVLCVRRSPGRRARFTTPVVWVPPASGGPGRVRVRPRSTWKRIQASRVPSCAGFARHGTRRSSLLPRVLWLLQATAGRLSGRRIGVGVDPTEVESIRGLRGRLVARQDPGQAAHPAASVSKSPPPSRAAAVTPAATLRVTSNSVASRCASSGTARIP